MTDGAVAPTYRRGVVECDPRAAQARIAEVLAPRRACATIVPEPCRGNPVVGCFS